MRENKTYGNEKLGISQGSLKVNVKSETKANQSSLALVISNPQLLQH